MYNTAAVGMLMLLCVLTPTHAQRVTSTASGETGLGAQESVAPPPGFPNGTGNDLVFGGSLDTSLQAGLTGRQNSKAQTSIYSDGELQLFAIIKTGSHLTATSSWSGIGLITWQAIIPVITIFSRMRG